MRMTLDEVLALNPCDRDERIAMFGDRSSLSAEEALEAGATVGDILWTIDRLGRDDILTAFIVKCARLAQLSSTKSSSSKTAARGAILECEKALLAGAVSDELRQWDDRLRAEGRFSSTISFARRAVLAVQRYLEARYLRSNLRLMAMTAGVELRGYVKAPVITQALLDAIAERTKGDAING